MVFSQDITVTLISVYQMRVHPSEIEREWDFFDAYRRVKCCKETVKMYEVYRADMMFLNADLRRDARCELRAAHKELKDAEAQLKDAEAQLKEAEAAEAQLDQLEE